MQGEIKLGILGGGQLGRMLLQAGIDLNLYTLILDPDPEAPCQSLCNEFVVGSFADYDTVYAFGKKCNVVTIEIEHVNTAALLQLKQEGVHVFPEPEVIKIIQDKGLQKEFYKNNAIPTADFRLLQNKTELLEQADFLPAFQKLRTLGYDGRGVTRLTSPTDFEKGFEAPTVLEKLVDYDKELAVLVARNPNGEVSCFPAVELVFHPVHNLVDYLFSPAAISPEIAAQAQEIAKQVIQALNMVGLLAVEMFLTKEGEILVNEVAPRPHNSGHHTYKANLTSQFEQHLRAILNLPLGNTQGHSAAVMLNLLGEPGFSGLAQYEGLPEALAIPGVSIHLYGKKFTRPARKMGHVIITAATVAEATQKANKVKEVIKVKA
ncbi:5-(carboxyamino)imidazole ribonucleotide synthase [Adhaeribacter pallidiroseus]|uniref:N5-carboxyaminoimidazole ribonucleotide synthase n=1 Tax=Adhaeribacter pallidiroseus TaxID=2072847 RepID=A0A369QKT6_9BACT|nr:5-(carboxyamino)imidazole ribonucleotide synthase [Adhaeribacter pallidiroseus]RDC63836.1 5-(carboxyamino)imidazole ribonucleotide synthase [Adhaeribacter pallidiroseus]